MSSETRSYRASLHHTHLMAADIEVTLAFYRRWFGAELIADFVILPKGVHRFADGNSLMVEAPDRVLIELFEPKRDAISPRLRAWFEVATPIHAFTPSPGPRVRRRSTSGWSVHSLAKGEGSGGSGRGGVGHDAYGAGGGVDFDQVA